MSTQPAGEWSGQRKIQASSESNVATVRGSGISRLSCRAFISGKCTSTLELSEPWLTGFASCKSFSFWLYSSISSLIHGIDVESNFPQHTVGRCGLFCSRTLGPSGCWVCGLCLGSASWWPQGPRQSLLRQGHVRCSLQLTITSTVSVADQHPPWPRPSNISGELINLTHTEQ